MTDPILKRLTRAILRAQKKLQRLASDEAWRTYMQLEAVVNARQYEQLNRAVALAYEDPSRGEARPVRRASRRKRGTAKRCAADEAQS